MAAVPKGTHRKRFTPCRRRQCQVATGSTDDLGAPTHKGDQRNSHHYNATEQDGEHEDGHEHGRQDCWLLVVIESQLMAFPKRLLRVDVGDVLRNAPKVPDPPDEEPAQRCRIEKGFACKG